MQTLFVMACWFPSLSDVALARIKNGANPEPSSPSFCPRFQRQSKKWNIVFLLGAQDRLINFQSHMPFSKCFSLCSH